MTKDEVTYWLNSLEKNPEQAKYELFQYMCKMQKFDLKPWKKQLKAIEKIIEKLKVIHEVMES